MPAIVIVGAQWGDEGKGKATDLLGDRVDYVVRYQGGNNAGHTVVIGDESYALHLLPSRVLSPRVVPVIGNGVVIDPQVLLDEIDGLQDRGVSCDKLLVSANAHLITPYHRALDKVTERFLGSAGIGTTGPGVRRQDRPDGDPGPGPVRPGHPAPEAGPGAAGEEPGADQGLQPARDRPGGVRGGVRAVRGAAAPLRGRHRAGPGPGA